MIRVLICDTDKATARQIGGAVDALAKGKGIGNIDMVFSNSLAKLDATLGMIRQNLVDLIFVHLKHSAGAAGADELMELFERLKDRHPRTHFAFVSDVEEHALVAFECGAGFVKLPVSLQEFSNTLSPLLEDIASAHKRSFAVKAAKSVVNMNLDDITFVETNKKGPIIHACNRPPVMTRGTLQALYERLASNDDRFVRAGGSFILNLDNVRATGESSVIFSDGEAIILPIRIRKPIADQFSAYLAGN